MIDVTGIQSVYSAMMGDQSLILSRLRSVDVTLSADERQYLADRLEGKIKLKTGPKPSLEMRYKKILSLAAYEACRKEGDKKTHAYENAAKVLGLSAKTIRNDLKGFKHRASDDILRIMAAAELEAISQK